MLELEKIVESLVTIDDPNAVVFFADGASIKYKLSNGDVFTLATGVTMEQVEDIVAALIVEGTGITTVYDDAGGTLTISVNQSELDHTNFQNIGTNSHDEIDQHIAANDNPHSVTAAQVGADPTGTAAAEVTTHENAADPHANYETTTQLNSRDTANRNRSNHTGTQLANTISDFEDAIKQVYDETTAQNNAEQVNTDNGNFLLRHDITKTPQHTSDYDVIVHYTWAYDDGGSNFQAELLIDGVVVREHEQEPKDVGGSDGGAGTDQRHMAVMKYRHAATANTDFDVDFRFKPQTNGVEATVRDSNVKIKRVLEV